MIKNPEKLKIGDRVHNGSALKGAVLSITSGKRIELVWDDRLSTDTILTSSPFWMFLDRYE